jgi:dipeptidyl-peptidase 4
VRTLRGHLLLIHGMVDENVHFRHTSRLITALTQADKSYEAVLFPEERHMPRRHEDLVYLERRLVEFLRTHLE